MMIRMLYLSRLIVFAILPICAVAQDYSVVFEGRPLTRVVAGFGVAESQRLSDDESFEYRVQIVARGGKFYWASRDMKELVKSESGVYVTYHAIDGAGYVRTFVPAMLGLLEQLPSAERAGEVAYMEQVVQQFTSISYFGNPAPSP